MSNAGSSQPRRRIAQAQPSKPSMIKLASNSLGINFIMVWFNYLDGSGTSGVKMRLLRELNEMFRKYDCEINNLHLYRGISERRTYSNPKRATKPFLSTLYLYLYLSLLGTFLSNLVLQFSDPLLDINFSTLQCLQRSPRRRIR